MGQQKRRRKWGGYRHGRQHDQQQLERLVADIRVENKERLRILAGERGEHMNVCLDSIVEFIWKRRERKLTAEQERADANP
jgi:hypothetical protein